MFNGNTTRVDWFGIKLAMRLHAADGYDAAVGEDLATFQEDRAVTFQKFVNEVPAEFKHLAQNWAPYRISAPGKMGDVDFTPSGQYANYYTSYATSVGVTASVFDILACAGTLANNPGMCSALNRHVAHLPQSQWTTSSLFYQAAPANYYANSGTTTAWAPWPTVSHTMIMAVIPRLSHITTLSGCWSPSDGRPYKNVRPQPFPQASSPREGMISNRCPAAGKPTNA